LPPSRCTSTSRRSRRAPRWRAWLRARMMLHARTRRVFARAHRAPSRQSSRARLAAAPSPGPSRLSEAALAPAHPSRALLRPARAPRRARSNATSRRSAR
jgi:hypothetical protein